MDLANLKDHLEEWGIELPAAGEEEAQQPKKKTDHYPKEIISVFAYLIGVRRVIFENEDTSPQMAVYERLRPNKPATIIRSLCMLRTEMERNYKNIRIAMQQEQKQLWGLVDGGYITREALEYLLENNIRLDIKNARRPDEYVVKINTLINQRISNCKDLFPSYVNWDYMKELFIMPGGTDQKGCEEAVRIYYENMKYYPYSCYINWIPTDVGNLLLNDSRFITTIYAMHGEEFTETGRITGLSELTQKSIDSFIMESTKLDMIVDCENSDPYKLAAALRNMDSSHISRINKLILVDDPNTAPVWKSFHHFVKNIQIKYINNERILSQKSLVDIRLAAQTMMEYCRNNVDSFILVSSDSDFWGLIEGMYDNEEDGLNARFLLFVERGQTSHALTQVLRDHDIYYAYLDQFYTGNCEDIKQTALLMEMKDYLQKNFSFNINTMFEEALAKTYVNYSDSEKKHFYNKYIRTLRMEIDPDGNVSLVFKK